MEWILLIKLRVFKLAKKEVNMKTMKIGKKITLKKVTLVCLDTVQLLNIIAGGECMFTATVSVACPTKYEVPCPLSPKTSQTSKNCAIGESDDGSDLIFY